MSFPLFCAIVVKGISDSFYVNKRSHFERMLVFGKSGWIWQQKGSLSSLKSARTETACRSCCPISAGLQLLQFSTAAAILFSHFKVFKSSPFICYELNNWSFSIDWLCAFASCAECCAEMWENPGMLSGRLEPTQCCSTGWDCNAYCITFPLASLVILQWIFLKTGELFSDHLLIQKIPIFEQEPKTVKRRSLSTLLILVSLLRWNSKLPLP